MVISRLQAFFGDDFEETLSSLRSTPGAFGNLVLGAARQVRLIDTFAIALMVSGWLWLIFGYGVAGNHSLAPLLLALLPSLLWLLGGIIGGLIFEIGGIGLRTLGYWEAYLLIALFAVFGAITLRLALGPRGRVIHRGPSLHPKKPN